MRSYECAAPLLRCGTVVSPYLQPTRCNQTQVTAAHVPPASQSIEPQHMQCPTAAICLEPTSSVKQRDSKQGILFCCSAQCPGACKLPRNAPASSPRPLAFPSAGKGHVPAATPRVGCCLNPAAARRASAPAPPAPLTASCKLRGWARDRSKSCPARPCCPSRRRRHRRGRQPLRQQRLVLQRSHRTPNHCARFTVARGPLRRACRHSTRSPRRCARRNAPGWTANAARRCSESTSTCRMPGVARQQPAELAGACCASAWRH